MCIIKYPQNHQNKLIQTSINVFCLLLFYPHCYGNNISRVYTSRVGCRIHDQFFGHEQVAKTVLQFCKFALVQDAKIGRDLSIVNYLYLYEAVVFRNKVRWFALELAKLVYGANLHIHVMHLGVLVQFCFPSQFTTGAQ